MMEVVIPLQPLSWAKPMQVCVGVCVGGTHWALSWLCFWLLIGGSAALLLNSSPFLRVSLICSVSMFKQTKWEKNDYSITKQWKRKTRLSLDRLAKYFQIHHFLSYWSRLTFVREPAWLWSNADGSAVLLILWRSAQIIPHTLSANPAQVRALRLNTLVHSLLLRWARNIYAIINTSSRKTLSGIFSGIFTSLKRTSVKCRCFWK